jgi:hypothetical protein
MGLSTKHRRWLLGAALLLTVAAAASVGGQDENDGAVVQADSSRDRVRHRNPERLADNGSDADVNLKNLKRPALPENVKDLFPAKSWYVPPPVSKTRPVPAAPPLPFVYVGKMIERGKAPTVFLESQNRTYLVHEDDQVGTNYRVDSIRPPLMTLTYLPLDIKQTMQIGEAN